MRKYLLLLMFLCLASLLHSQNKFELVSPNGEIKVLFNLSDKIYYSIDYNGEVLLKDNSIQLTLKNQVLGQNPKLRRQKRMSIDEYLTPVVPLKYSKINNRYNQLLLTFKDYSVEFRAFDDGVAYRFLTSQKGDVEVMSEEFAINFPSDYLLHLQQPGGFKTAYEEPYTHIWSNTWKPEDRMAVLPALIDTKKDYKILISESDLTDYPCMFLKGTGENGLISTFPKTPLAFTESGDRSVKITEEADYIAKTKGTRNYPWRYFVISRNDKQLIENTMTYRLAEKNQLQDVSWIKPGQVSWEWWNDASPYGPDVNFVAGYNLATYKYYIDFASKFGIPYIIMDEGWAESTRDPYTPNPKVDLHELIRYGKERNVGIVLWLTWLTVENNFDLFKTFNEWGVKGLKIDFMDRSDQWMVNYYERVAREAAKYHLFVDFHGSFKPAGLEYKYPNVLSYEGVRGMEQMGGCYPDNSLYLPFIRNAVGPMDYTPGIFETDISKLNPDNHSYVRSTLARQLALYVTMYSPLQMAADLPENYNRFLDAFQFIKDVALDWDKSYYLEAEPMEYITVARCAKNTDNWFVGGTNGEVPRIATIDFSFLPTGQKYIATIYRDGKKAHYRNNPTDYVIETKTVTNKTTLKISTASGGGFAISLVPKAS